MLVSNRMTKEPVTMTGEDLLIQARLKDPEPLRLVCSGGRCQTIL